MRIAAAYSYFSPDVLGCFYIHFLLKAINMPVSTQHLTGTLLALNFYVVVRGVCRGLLELEREASSPAAPKKFFAFSIQSPAESASFFRVSLPLSGANSNPIQTPTAMPTTRPTVIFIIID